MCYLKNVKKRIWTAPAVKGLNEAEELTKIFILILNLKNPAVSMVYTHIFQRYKG